MHFLEDEALRESAYEDLFFIARPEKASEYVEILSKVVAKHTYPHTMVGAYIQPIEHNTVSARSNLRSSMILKTKRKKKRSRLSFTEAGIEMINNGAQFTRPYGNLVPVIYDQEQATPLQRQEG